MAYELDPGHSLDDFEFWLSRIERKLSLTMKKPTTREEAHQVWISTKNLKEECLTRELPEELLDEELYQADPKISAIIDRYNVLASTLSDNTAKAETLCSCWDKLDNDVSELTQAMSVGGVEKLTEEKLDESISQLSQMFKERRSLIQTLTPKTVNFDRYRR